MNILLPRIRRVYCPLHLQFFWRYQGYDNPSFYTSGANIPSIITTEPNSARIKVGGAWKSGIPYIKVGGVWKRGEMYIKQGGIWKKGS